MAPTLPDRAILELARRPLRLRHYVWHRLRHSWLRLTDAERRAAQEVDPAWLPPRPARDARGNPMADNDSGEDFLYMNRWLIAQADAIFARAGGTRVEGWPRVPPPEDPAHPVPDFPDSGLEALKSAEYYKRHLVSWERQYTDTNYLRSVTLGRLGSEIEFTICNDMHLRWTAPSPVGYRPTAAPTRSVGREWDAPAYSYLGDIYASHVNPFFWKLRGWVDHRVDDWARSHDIARGPRWVGAWVGAAEGTPGAAVEALERIDCIISSSRAGGDGDGFIRPRPR